MNRPLIAIVGPSGTGKSTSLRNLNPSTTHVLDLERKGFPFPQIHLFKNVHSVSNMGEFSTALTKALGDGDCETIVIDSFTKYTELLLALAQQSYKGYDIWNFYNKAIREMLEKVKNTRSNVIMTAIDEIVKIPQADGSETAQRRIKVQGKAHEGLIEKEMVMVLFTEARKNKATSKMEYVFQTNTDGLTSAKSPMDMFSDQYVGNDMQEIIKRANEYYLAGQVAGKMVNNITQPVMA